MKAVVDRARACVGARFRLHGRHVSEGFDCIGVAGAAFGIVVPADYPLRGNRQRAVAGFVARMGLVDADGSRPGDLMLLRTGPAQLHLAIRVEGGFIHADAGLRRVVETPGDPPWPLVQAWRMLRERR